MCSGSPNERSTNVMKICVLQPSYRFRDANKKMNVEYNTTILGEDSLPAAIQVVSDSLTLK